MCYTYKYAQLKIVERLVCPLKKNGYMCTTKSDAPVWPFSLDSYDVNLQVEHRQPRNMVTKMAGIRLGLGD